MTGSQRVYPEALIGWRSWIVSDGELFSTMIGSVRSILTEERARREGLGWRELTPPAQCFNRTRSHPAPSPGAGCECGWHAWREPLLAARFSKRLQRVTQQVIGADAASGQVVWGAIAGSGLTRVHHLGWRSERAQVLGIISAPEISPRERDQVSAQLGRDLWIRDPRALAERVTALSLSKPPRELIYSSDRRERLIERARDLLISLGVS